MPVTTRAQEEAAKTSGHYSSSSSGKLAEKTKDKDENGYEDEDGDFEEAENGEGRNAKSNSLSNNKSKSKSSSTNTSSSSNVDLEDGDDIEPGAKVSWKWGGGRPSGTVQGVYGREKHIESKNGNTITRKGDKGNPAVEIVQDNGTHVLKRASEIEVE